MQNLVSFFEYLNDGCKEKYEMYIKMNKCYEKQLCVHLQNTVETENYFIYCIENCSTKKKPFGHSFMKNKIHAVLKFDENNTDICKKLSTFNQKMFAMYNEIITLIYNWSGRKSQRRLGQIQSLLDEISAIDEAFLEPYSTIVKLKCSIFMDLIKIDCRMRYMDFTDTIMSLYNCRCCIQYLNDKLCSNNSNVKTYLPFLNNYLNMLKLKSSVYFYLAFKTILVSNAQKEERTYCEYIEDFSNVVNGTITVMFNGNSTVENKITLKKLSEFITISKMEDNHPSLNHCILYSTDEETLKNPDNSALCLYFASIIDKNCTKNEINLKLCDKENLTSNGMKSTIHTRLEKNIYVFLTFPTLKKKVEISIVDFITQLRRRMNICIL